MNDDIVSRLTALGDLCMVDFPLIPPDAPELCMSAASEIAQLRHEVSELKDQLKECERHAGYLADELNGAEQEFKEEIMKARDEGYERGLRD